MAILGVSNERLDPRPRGCCVHQRQVGEPGEQLQPHADDLIDRVVGYVAPVLTGGGGLSSLGGPGAPSIDLARRLELMEVRRIGPDIRLVAVPVDRARPRLPLFASGDPTLAERVEERLVGFGEASPA
jgi:hypothetical protein